LKGEKIMVKYDVIDLGWDFNQDIELSCMYPAWVLQEKGWVSPILYMETKGYVFIMSDREEICYLPKVRLSGKKILRAVKNRLPWCRIVE